MFYVPIIGFTGSLSR